MSPEDWLGIFTALVGAVMAIRPKRSSEFFMRHAFARPPSLTRFKPFRLLIYLAFFVIGIGMVAASLVGMFEQI